MKTTFLILLVITFLGACTSTKEAKTGRMPESPENLAEKNQTINPDAQNLTLLDYLRREPSLRITGKHPDAHIMVRGASTVTGDNKPLFIVNGSQIGTSYQTAAGMVEIADIQSIEVLKDVSSTNTYGSRGAAGVIVIKTRKK